MRIVIKLFAIAMALFSSILFAKNHFCPPAELVKQNEHTIQAWQHDRLYWSIQYRGWPYADKIGFDRVFYYPENNKLDCRYRWENPKQPGTYLWTAVELSPDANTKVSIQGVNWKSVENFHECESVRPETCAFEITSDVANQNTVKPKTPMTAKNQMVSIEKFNPFKAIDHQSLYTLFPLIIILLLLAWAYRRQNNTKWFIAIPIVLAICSVPYYLAMSDGSHALPNTLKQVVSFYSIGVAILFGNPLSLVFIAGLLISVFILWTPNKIRYVVIALMMAMACTIYVLLKYTHLQNSAALYVGLPAILALGMSLSPKSKTALGSSMKGITIALLIAPIIFREGYICVLFAAPIFYLIGAIIGYAIDKANKQKDGPSKLQSAAIASVFTLLAFEGITSFTSFPRYNEVVVSKVVHSNINEVRSQLAKTPVLGQDKPLFLKIFPYPTGIKGQGLNVGDERIVNFVAYKHILWSKVEGDLVLKITESQHHKVRFDIVKDDSYLSHYVKWEGSEVMLKPIDDNHTKVTWRLSYKRLYDPAWYFYPLQTYAVKLAATELIDHAATPAHDS